MQFLFWQTKLLTEATEMWPWILTISTKYVAFDIKSPLTTFQGITCWSKLCRLFSSFCLSFQHDFYYKFLQTNNKNMLVQHWSVWEWPQKCRKMCASWRIWEWMHTGSPSLGQEFFQVSNQLFRRSKLHCLAWTESKVQVDQPIELNSAISIQWQMEVWAVESTEKALDTTTIWSMNSCWKVPLHCLGMLGCWLASCDPTIYNYMHLICRGATICDPFSLGLTSGIRRQIRRIS